jgi:alpha-N-arabinofuranosidase
MGLLEFCEWCEDLNMEAVLAVWAGYSLDRQSVPAADYPIYAKEALEEIEYVTGDVTTEWGARRAKDGHPAPFKLHAVEVGNEDPAGANSTYDGRFTVFYDTLKAKYPNLKVIATARTSTRQPDIIDEHHYMNIQSAQQLSRQYASRAPGATKVFVGEWATRVGAPTPNWSGAIADAAFLTGLERNPDLVVMSCYAPLFVNVNQAYPMYAGGPSYPNGMQWPTDLIGYDAGKAFGSPSYYVQALFSKNRGDTVLPCELAAQDIFAAAARDTAAGEIVLKMVNLRAEGVPMEIGLAGVSNVEKNASGWIISGGLTDMNSVEKRDNVAPKAMAVENAAAKFTYNMPANSVVVLRIKAK